VRTVRTHADGPSLNDALARTGLVQLAFCVVLSVAILLA
jgi:1,4-dihydroxy-2-naphthoate octaprenyltransferase